MRKVWTFSPQSGGRKIPPSIQEVARQRILRHAEKNYAGKYLRIDVRFKGALCYIDAYREPFVGKKHPTAQFGETRQEFIERWKRSAICFQSDPGQAGRMALRAG